MSTPRQDCPAAICDAGFQTEVCMVAMINHVLGAECRIVWLPEPTLPGGCFDRFAPMVATRWLYRETRGTGGKNNG